MSAADLVATRRLTLALDAGRCCPEDVRPAVELAAIIGAELEGLFVEDSDLMNLVQLPFAQEFGGRSGRGRPIVRSTMEALLKRRVERVVDELERVGKQCNLLTSHTTARGKVLSRALERVGQHDVLLLPPRVVVAPASLRPAASPVMVWYEDGAKAAPTLDLAVELALRMRADLVVGFPASRFATERDLRGELGRWFVRLPGRVRGSPVARVDAEGIITAMRAARPADLVLDARGRFATEATLDRMLRMLGARVILVGRLG